MGDTADETPKYIMVTTDHLGFGSEGSRQHGAIPFSVLTALCLYISKRCSLFWS